MFRRGGALVVEDAQGKEADDGCQRLIRADEEEESARPADIHRPVRRTRQVPPTSAPHSRVPTTLTHVHVCTSRGTMEVDDKDKASMT